ncbi:hypothetical protein N9063_00760 [Deltaproteobacteria bacterium]|nr:hypothetical protein [Deltaproteobacteria bacterium]
MSLINQMLRDLETRRKTENQQLPSTEGPAVFVADGASRRLLILVAGGLVLIGLVMGGLAIVDRMKSAPNTSTKLISVTAAPAQPVAIAQQQPITDVVEKKVTSEPVLTVVETAVPVAVSDDTSQVGTVANASLLNLGVLETVASSRLLLEFEHRPDYVWWFQERDETQVILRLKQSGGVDEIEIPQLQGPLLKQVRVKEEEQGLLVLIEANQKIKVQTVELPADPFHGERLLVEFYPQQQPVGKPIVKETAAVVAVAEKGKVEVVAPKPNRVNKTVVKLTPAEQAEQAYQTALQKLQRKDYPAAEKGFVQALSLQPRLLDARLQLISLLQEIGRHDEAEKSLLQGLELHPSSPQLRKGYARRLMDEGFLQGAIDVLQLLPQPEFVSDLEYYALLTALQQENGQHQAASSGYRQLLKYRSKEAVWWLGLAISLEQLGDTSGAKDAYQQAIALPGLRADLQDYIQTRLQAL